MSTKKKRLSLAEFRQEAKKPTRVTMKEKTSPQDISTKGIHKSVYIPPAVLERIDLLALQERPGPGRRKTFNSIVLEGLDLVFKSRGLPGVEEILHKK